MLEIVVCDDDIADLECAVTMLHKIFTSQKIAYHIEQFASANQMLENISNIDTVSYTHLTLPTNSLV